MRPMIALQAENAKLKDECARLAAEVARLSALCAGPGPDATPTAEAAVAGPSRYNRWR